MSKFHVQDSSVIERRLRPIYGKINNIPEIINVNKDRELNSVTQIIEEACCFYDRRVNYEFLPKLFLIKFSIEG